MSACRYVTDHTDQSNHKQVTGSTSELHGLHPVLINLKEFCVQRLARNTISIFSTKAHWR